MAWRRSSRPKASRSSPSRVSWEPGSGSTMRSSASSSELFPAPVRPTTPRRSPGDVQKLRFFSTKGRPSLYRTCRFFTSSTPRFGQPAIGRRSVRSAASEGSCVA